MGLNILDWLDTANEYSDLIKTGVAAASTYASYQDQKKKNLMQQQAYDDYMKQVAEAGKEARAAIDINYTPMVVSGVPTTKADVTDFTAVAAKGGLMSIPNRQRKRYARGPDEVDVMEFDEEVITPEGFKMETGVDVTGEQVKYNTGNPRQDAWGIWNSGGIDQEIYEFDFEIFFQSGDWMDMLRGQAPVQGNMQMASAYSDDDLQAYENYKYTMNEQMPGMPIMEIDEWLRMEHGAAKLGVRNGGIIGLRHGGRPGYNTGEIVTADAEAVVSEVPQSQVNQIQGSQMTEQAYNEIFRKFFERFPNIDTDNMTLADMVAMLQAEGVVAQDVGILGLDKSMGMITPQSAERSAQRISMGDTQWGDIPYAKGGRARYAYGPDVEEVEMMDEEFVGDNELKMEEGVEIGPMAGLKAFSKEENLKRFKAAKRLAKEKGISLQEALDITMSDSYRIEEAQGGRIGAQEGGIMDMGGLEKDYRFSGGFVPIGAYEKKDDVPARLSKNEFVFTADAVRAAGGGSINKGAKRMYETMKNLEAKPEAQRMTA